MVSHHVTCLWLTTPVSAHLRRISCHGKNHSHTRCEYLYTTFLCYQHCSEYSLLGSKFSTNLLFAASKCHVTIQRQSEFKMFKMAERSDGCSGETLLAPCTRKKRLLRSLFDLLNMPISSWTPIQKHLVIFSAASFCLYKEPAMFHHCNHPIVRPSWTTTVVVCDVAFTRCEQQISWKFSTKRHALAAVLITKKNCLQIFAASMRVIFAMTRNPPLGPRQFPTTLYFLDLSVNDCTWCLKKSIAFSSIIEPMSFASFSEIM